MTATAAPPTHGGGGTIHHAVVVPDQPPIFRSGMSAWFARWWVPCLVLPMMMASDWKWRRRAAQEALGGSIDSQVIIELAVYAGVLLYLLWKYGKAPRWARTDNLRFSMWAWVSITFVSAFYSVFPKLGVVRATQFVIVATLAQAIGNHATLKHMHRLAHGYLVMLSGAVAIGTVWHGPLNKTVAGRFHWMFVHPVPAGLYLMCGTVIAAAYWYSKSLREELNFWPRWVYGAVCSWIGLGLLLTKTRGSIVAVAFALAFVVLFHTKSSSKITAIIMGIVTVLAAALAVGRFIVSYLERGNSATQLATLNDRTNLWKLAITDYFKRPFFGYGLGSARGIFLDEIKLGGGHNAFINVLVDQGGVGMVAFVAIVAIIFWRLFRFGPGSVGYRESLLLLPLFVGLFVNSLTAEFMATQANNAALWLFMIIAWLTVISRAQDSVDAAARVPLKTAAPAESSDRVLAGSDERKLGATRG